MNIIERYEELGKSGIVWSDRVWVINKEFWKDYAQNEKWSHVLAQFVYRKKKNIVTAKVESNIGMQWQDWKHAWVKDEDTSIFVKNPAFKSKTIEEIKAEVFRDAKDYKPKYRKIERKPVKDGHLLVLDCADIHIGKLSMLDETNDAYSIDIAVQRCLEWVEGIIQKSNGFNIDKILFVIWNDILHIDSPHRKTTAGTPQDTDWQWWSAFQHAKDLYIKVLESLVTIADVDVVFNPSNHDYTSGYFLADSIASWFHNSENITFDVKPTHRKYYQYWSSMIGTTHGDGAREWDLALIMAQESPKMWAGTKYRHWYLHHIHHKKAIKYQSAKDYVWVTLEYLRTPSGSDGWHDRNWYVWAKKAIEGFIHHPEQWQICRLSHYF